MRSARLAVWQSKSRERATEAKSVHMSAWWHLTVVFKLCGPQLSSGGARGTAGRAQHSRLGRAQRGNGVRTERGAQGSFFLVGAVGAAQALRLPTLQGVVKGEPQRVALGFREGGRRGRACTLGVSSAGEQGTV